MNDVPMWRTARFWINIVLAIVAALQRSGVMPEVLDGDTLAMLAASTNLGVSAAKRTPAAPALGYR